MYKFLFLLLLVPSVVLAQDVTGPQVDNSATQALFSMLHSANVREANAIISATESQKS